MDSPSFHELGVNRLIENIVSLVAILNEHDTGNGRRFRKQRAGSTAPAYTSRRFRRLRGKRRQKGSNRMTTVRHSLGDAKPDNSTLGRAR